MVDEETNKDKEEAPENEADKSEESGPFVRY